MLKDTAEQVQQEQRSLTALATLSAPNGPLEQLKSALQELASRLAPAHGVRRVGKALSWPFSKSEINAILERIERQKSVFSLALENDHMLALNRLLCFYLPLIDLVVSLRKSRTACQRCKSACSLSGVTSTGYCR